MKKESEKVRYGMSVRIEKEVLDAVRVAAKKNGRTIKGQLKQAVFDGLKKAK